MSNEITVVELLGANRDGEPRRFTIADGASVSKGALLALLDPRTASSGCMGPNVVAGIASEDHVPDIGVTTIALWTDGIFKGYASGSITAGYKLVASKYNFIAQVGDAVSYAVAASFAAVMGGRSLENASTGEQFTFRFKE